MLVDLMNVAYNASRKSEEFSDKALELIENPKNKKIRKFHENAKNNTYCSIKMMKLGT